MRRASWRVRLADEQAAHELFRQGARRYIDRVNRTIKRPVTQGQFDAMVSLCFNIGEGAFEGSSVARLLNQGDIAGAAQAFLIWNKAGGRELPGLPCRKAEMACSCRTTPVSLPSPPTRGPVCSSRCWRPDGARGEDLRRVRATDEVLRQLERLEERLERGDAEGLVVALVLLARSRRVEVAQLARLDTARLEEGVDVLLP